MLVMQYVAVAIAGAGLMVLSLHAQGGGRRALAILWGVGLALLIAGNASSELGLSGAALAGATVGLLASLAERRPPGTSPVAGPLDEAQPPTSVRPR